MGVSFACPQQCGHRLAVWFKNPVDGGTPIAGKKLWEREGETFDTLTLRPSVDATGAGHWHGHVTRGFIDVAAGECTETT